MCTSAGSDLEMWLSRQATYPRRACLPAPQQDRPNTISIIQLMKVMNHDVTACMYVPRTCFDHTLTVF